MMARVDFRYDDVDEDWAEVILLYYEGGIVAK
jgi:hypothetical protein